MQREMLFWIWLSEALGAASRDFRRLITLYDGPYELFHADEAELERIEGITPKTLQKLSDKNLGSATAILDTCEKLQIGILPYGDPAYPDALYEIDRPPVLLYYRGRLPDFKRRLAIGMVGMRKMSAYGLRTAYKISYELAAAGALIVSGMAEGIDGVCAAAAIAAGGETVAVLGSGVDVIYPKHHKPLSMEIVENGVLFSEYPPGTPPIHYHFPVRNRLIAGISQGTVVVEAGIGSGSLITAKEAVLQGREVFALPANVGSRGAEGTNGLLRDGATLALDASDILKPYLYTYAETLKPEAVSKLGDRSEVDPHLLDRMGVIQWSGDKTESEPPKKAVPAVPRARKPFASANKKQQAEDSVPVAPLSNRPIDEPPQKQETPDQVLSSLSEVQRVVLEVIPDDRGISTDALSSLGYPFAEISSALTMRIFPQSCRTGVL